MTASPQTDMLDYVVDNPRTNRREIWRNGECRLTCARGCDHPLLESFDAAGPWGTFPPSAPISADDAYRVAM